MAHRRYYKPKHIKKFADKMRRKLSSTELMFLRRLTLANVAGFDFQVRIGFYVADFVFPAKMLIIEIDGPSHQPEHDAKRDEWLTIAGFTTWRIKNQEAKKQRFGLCAGFRTTSAPKADAVMRMRSNGQTGSTIEPPQSERG